MIGGYENPGLPGHSQSGQKVGLHPKRKIFRHDLCDPTPQRTTNYYNVTNRWETINYPSSFVFLFGPESL